MKSIAELINVDEPAIDLIRQWVAAAQIECEVLPPSTERDQVLLALQVSTRSTLGAVAYETGGMLVDRGWLRVLGSGHPKLPRNLYDWNRGRTNGCCLVADDAIGGFFGMNTGAWGDPVGQIYYWAPDDLDWECLDFGYSDFLHWALTGDLNKFYGDLRWPNWRNDLESLPGDRCFNFFPPLWLREGGVERSSRRAILVSEAFDLKCDMARQLRE